MNICSIKTLQRLVFGLFLTTIHSTTIAEASPTVKIAPGIVNGISCSSTAANAYLSIPFALPPLGPLRFAPPVAYTGSYPSTGLNATTRPKSCVQFGNEFLEQPPWSEDCLYLSVWTPSNATSTSKLPVKFWIYGGADNAGGSANPLYDGCNLAGMGDQVVVSANYRLGALGFMAAEEAGINGNMGVQDTLLALRWVQDNIGAFGGDPVSEIFTTPVQYSLEPLIIFWRDRIKYLHLDNPPGPVSHGY
jgi:carboxylesterase type B